MPEDSVTFAIETVVLGVFTLTCPAKPVTAIEEVTSISPLTVANVFTESAISFPATSFEFLVPVMLFTVASEIYTSFDAVIAVFSAMRSQANVVVTGSLSDVPVNVICSPVKSMLFAYVGIVSLSNSTGLLN